MLQFMSGKKRNRKRSCGTLAGFAVGGREKPYLLTGFVTI
jgi:hypothetical protein